MALECGWLLEIPGNCEGQLWRCYLFLVSQISEFWPSLPACDMYCLYEKNVLKLLQRTSAGMACYLQHLLQAGEDGHLEMKRRREFSVGSLANG